MQIELLKMSREMYPEIAEVDDKSFCREGNLRSVLNMDLLRESFPQGCLVIRKEQKICGYAFSKVLGSVGYIGPIGIHPEEQGQGLAKILLEACIKTMIEAGCRTIGLETMPESGKHIGLYQSAGFELTYPTVLYRCPKELLLTDNHNIRSGAEVTLEELEAFDRRITEQYNGFSILADLEAALRVNKESVFFYMNRDRIEGTLFFCRELYRFVYGVFLQNERNMEQFLALYTVLKRVYPDTNLLLRVNSRYKKMAQLQQYGFIAEGSLARMTYHGFHGIYEESDSMGLILKGWVG